MGYVKVARNTNDAHPWLSEIGRFFAERERVHWHLAQPFSALELYQNYHLEKRYPGLEIETESVATL